MRRFLLERFIKLPHHGMQEVDLLADHSRQLGGPWAPPLDRLTRARRCRRSFVVFHLRGIRGLIVRFPEARQKQWPGAGALELVRARVPEPVLGPYLKPLNDNAVACGQLDPESL